MHKICYHKFTHRNQFNVNVYNNLFHKIYIYIFILFNIVLYGLLFYTIVLKESKKGAIFSLHFFLSNTLFTFSMIGISVHGYKPGYKII